MLSARILANGQHYQLLPEDHALPPLAAALAEVFPQRIRRIDRFTQLALLGSGRCAGKHPPQPGCAVYLGTNIGPLSSNIAVQESIVAGHELPMPVAFINTLGSGAAFQVAANLGLSGPATCPSRSRATLQAVLASALIDLAAGAVEQALVGVVEEIVLPLQTHRRRHGLPTDQPLAEGSHWWLLAAADESPAGPVLHWHPHLEGTALKQQLAGYRDTTVGVARAMGGGQTAWLREHLPQAQDTGSMAFHDCIEAAWLMQHADRNCALVSGSHEDTFELFHCLA